MENQGFQIEQLDFQPKSNISIEIKRKILEYYSRADHEKHRKSRAQLFVKQYIKGLFSVLGINLNKLQFIPQQSLCTELTLFMQNCKKINQQFGECILIKENQFIILMEGIIAKKQDSHVSINQSLCSQFMKRKPRNSSNQSKNSKLKDTVALAAVSNFKKLFRQRFQSNQKLCPKVIYYDSNDKKPFQCRSDIIYLQFSQLSLQKLQNWVQNKEKQSIINFISNCFGIEDRKCFSKLVTKVNKHKIYQKSQFTIQPNTIYLIYQGEIILKTKQYQISLNKNSMLYKSSNLQFDVWPGDIQTTLISIQICNLVEQLNQNSNDILKEIMKKLQFLHQQRTNLLKKIEQKIEQQILIQPIFNTQILKIKTFERNNYQQIKQNLSDYRKFSIPRSSSRPESTRFRVAQPIQYDQNQIQSQLSIFLSNYPYMKIVQSQIKINNILKLACPYRNSQRKSTIEKKNISQDQKRKAEKQRKRMYYMNKVRKLKIKNIAQKQIPNGHKKKFKVDEAQKQISDYSLFTNIIQYPTNGVSEDAVKQTRNKNMIRNMIKLSSLNTKLERKTVGNNHQWNKTSQGSKQKISNKYFGIDTCYNELNDSMIQSNNQNFEQRKTTSNIKEGTNQLDMDPCSFYFTKTLSPHLPTQKQIKQKLKTSQHIFNRKNKQNYRAKLQFTQNTMKHIESDKTMKQSSEFKPSYINIQVPKGITFKSNCQRIKTTL